MANKGSYLKTNEFLAVGDYLVSESGLFFVLMQTDGNLCVYRGTPEDIRGFAVWCSMGKSLEKGQYFAVMQEDGNFCVYKGNSPGDASVTGFVWGSMRKSLEKGQYFAVMQEDGNFLSVL